MDLFSILPEHGPSSSSRAAAAVGGEHGVGSIEVGASRAVPVKQGDVNDEEAPAAKEEEVLKAGKVEVEEPAKVQEVEEAPPMRAKYAQPAAEQEAEGETPLTPNEAAEFMMDASELVPESSRHWFIIFARNVLVIMVGATVITCLPLLLPLERVNVSIWQGWTYWFVYNPFIVVVYCIASFPRIQSLLTREADSRPIKLPDPLFDWTAWIVLGMSALFCGVLFIIVALLWGMDRVIFSYSMLYCAPAALGVADTVYTFLSVPWKMQDRYVHLIVQAYNFLVNAPIFLVLFCVLCASLATGKSVIIKVVICISLAGVRSGFKVVSGMIIGNLLKKGQMSASFMDSQMSMQIEAIIGMADLITLPSGDQGLVILGSTVGLAFAQSLSYTRVCFACKMAKEEINLRPPAVPKGAWVHGARIEESAMQMAFRQNEIIASLNDSGADAVKKAMIGIMDRHVILVALPAVFLCAFSLIMNIGNHSRYFLYECTWQEPLEGIYSWVCVKWGVNVVSICLDLFVLAKFGMRTILFQLYSIKLSGSIVSTIAVLSFAALVFTSCLLIKHDGLYILHLLSTCKDYSGGTED